MNSPSNNFVRNNLTWLAYCMLAYIGFSQAILGPLMPFLRSELNLNYTLGGLLPAAIATGLILSGLTGAWLARHFSRQVLFWSGSGGLALGIVILGLSHQFGLVLLGILGMGFGGSLTQIMLQAILSDQHGEKRSIALTEANVGASFSATLTPLVIGGLQRAGLEWRAIAILTVLLLVILAVTFRRVQIPDSPPEYVEDKRAKSTLPLSFWLYWIVLFFMVSFEMTLSVWTTDFLASVVRLSRQNAVLAYGAFPAAMLTGRLIGSRLTHYWPSITLLFVSLGISLVGFLIFWLTRLPALNILGLFLTGLGIANQYPLTMSIAVGLSKGKTNQASARISLGVGAALLTAPLVLGWLADRFGLQNAFGLVVALMSMALIVVFLNNRFFQHTKT